MKKTKLRTVMAEGAAPVIDAVLTVLDGVPVLGTAVAVLKGWDDFRARMMTAKFQSFLEGLGDKSPEQVQEMLEAFNDSPEVEQMGETLLLTLESYTALEKCSLLGKLFCAYLEQRLNNQDFRRLALAINVAFPDDLLEYLSLDSHNVDLVGTARCMPYLVSAGLAREKPYGTIASLDGNMPRLYSYTALGQAFRSAINSG
ncbi:hypothetical protein [Polaromonas jejuensis]|uniref:DUF4393 domain-containing protein n=1 Tax=Polaromonas jejuensis TaxID=457502 RepID=A0ABW0QJP1_9BURK|nr:hypothetical protein [Polaromonas jejuensis]